MKKDKANLQDELLPEYDLIKLRVRKVGPERKSFAGKPVIQLDPDAVEAFPNDVLVNKLPINKTLLF